MDSSATSAAVHQAWMIAKAAEQNRIALLLTRSAAVKCQWNTPAIKHTVRAVFSRLHVRTKT